MGDGRVGDLMLLQKMCLLVGLTHSPTLVAVVVVVVVVVV
jgi:hypothetical protein